MQLAWWTLVVLVRFFIRACCCFFIFIKEKMFHSVCFNRICIGLLYGLFRVSVPYLGIFYCGSGYLGFMLGSRQNPSFSLQEQGLDARFQL